MKKILLVMFAVAMASASFAQMESPFRMAKQTKLSDKRLVLPGKNLLNKESATLVSSRQSRTINEDGSVDPKILKNVSAMNDTTYVLTANNTNSSGTAVQSKIMFGTYYDPVLVKRFDGNTITKINTFVGPYASKLTVWVTNAQTGEVLWQKTDPLFSTKSEMKSYSVACDYKLDASVPIMVGYTATYSGTTIAFPVAANSMTNGLLLDFGDGSGMSDYSSYGTAYIECVTEGDAGLADNDVLLNEVTGDRVKVGDTYFSLVSLTNLGAQPVKTIKLKEQLGDDVVYEVIGEEDGTDVVPYLGGAQFVISGKVPAKSGRYVFGVSADEVNGQADGFADDNYVSNIMVAIENVARRKVVMEEFTGTWCGWCPRGIVGLEKMKEQFPNDFIAISVHAGDGLEDATYKNLSYNMDFPSAFLNRIGLIDPYYGSVGDVADDVAYLASTPCEALIGLSCDLSDDQKAIDLTTTLKFMIAAKGSDYRLAYVLTEDSLTGFDQTNYYNYMYAQVENVDELPEDLRFLYDTGELVGQSVYYQPMFNDVSRGIYDLSGVAGSLDNINFVEGRFETHNYSITIPETVENLNNVNLIVMLLDMATGEVVTAEKAKIGENNWATGLGKAPVAADKAVVRVADGAISVESASAASVQLYTADGKLVRTATVNGSVSVPTFGLSAGTYIVRVVGEAGITVKKVNI